MLDDVLVVGPVLLLAANHRLPVAARNGVNQAVHRRQHARQQQRKSEAPVAAPLLGHLNRRLHDEIARDAEHDEQLREGRARRRRGGSDLLEVTDERFVDLLPLTSDGEDGLEPVAGLFDEPGPLGQAPL